MLTTVQRTKSIRGSFTRLPAEIRNQIYRLVLIADPAYIDLSPKTTRTDITNNKARQHHTRRLEREIKPSLRLLRVNKQINNEAASIFYGETEFRFTCSKGWYILDAFLRTIGLKNQAFLRKIAIHVPWSGKSNDHFQEGLKESGGTLRYIDLLIKRLNLRPCSASMAFRIKRSVHVLEKHGSLTNFRLILPDSFDLSWLDQSSTTLYFPNAQYDAVLRPSKFENLKVELIRLHGGYTPPPSDTAQFWRAYTTRDHVVPRQAFRRAGYVVSDVAYDEMGYWPVALKDGEEIPMIEGDGDGDDVAE